MAMLSAVLGVLSVYLDKETSERLGDKDGSLERVCNSSDSHSDPHLGFGSGVGEWTTLRTGAAQP